jgi:hypothetical protein
MTSDWYEVWVDDGLPVPYVLIVFPDKQLTGGIVVVDPKETDKVVHNAPDYENAKMWLLEEEYKRVEGRMTAFRRE